MISGKQAGTEVSGFAGTNCLRPNLLPGQQQDIKGSKCDGLVRTVIRSEVMASGPEPSSADDGVHWSRGNSNNIHSRSKTCPPI